MFPNDDICNVKAAKNAAKRIFQRYKAPQQKKSSSEGLGQQEVSSLIKNAYNAINIAYDPSLNDVSSFMSVFGVQQNGKINLDRIQELAVKYLCGEEALKRVPNNPQAETQEKLPKQKQDKKKQDQKKYQNPLSFRDTNKQLPESQYQSSVLTSSRLEETNKYFLYQQNSKQQHNSINQELTKSKSNRDTQSIIEQAKKIFEECKNNQEVGITVKQASQLLTRTYQLVRKNRFLPSEDDVRIWMKLCDIKKNGVVEWTSYENFIKRLMERQLNQKYQQTQKYQKTQKQNS